MYRGAVTDLGPHDARIAAAAAARLQFYRSLGNADDEPLRPFAGPAAIAGTRWPSRPRWRVIERAGRTAIASDSLSDPWDDEFGIGFGLELWIETDARMGVVVGSWLAAAIEEASYTVAGHGGVRTMLDDLGTVAIEISGRAFPADARAPSGRVGILLGVPTDAVPGWITLPEGRARLVTMTVLTPGELAHITAVGVAGRTELARALEARDLGFLSRLDRDDAVKRRSDRA